MKKINRLVSAALAACMSLTMFASAVELDAAVNEPLALHAGSVISGKVYIHDADGAVMDTVPYEVEIPEGATAEEENLMVGQAAADAYQSTKATARTNPGYMTVLASDMDVYIPRASGSPDTDGDLILSHRFSKDYDEICLVLFDISSGISGINLRLKSTGFSRVLKEDNGIRNGECEVHFYSGVNYNGETFEALKNKTLRVYASANTSGTADVILFGV